VTNKDHYLLPIERLFKNQLVREKKIEFFFYILNKFHGLTQGNKRIKQIINELKDKTESKDSKVYSYFDDITSEYKFSLNEKKSEIYITPYHLSYFISCLSPSPKTKGQFNTPFYIADFIAEKALELYSSNDHSLKDKKESNYLELSYADIACGTGNLIITLLYKLIERESNFISNLKEHFLNTISSNIFCFDINLFALQICKFRLLFFILHHFPGANVLELNLNCFQSNSLIKNSSSFFNNSDLFDIILGNPPFMCYGLRAGQEYSSDLKAYLRSNYETAEYKLPLYPLFIERSLELLKDKGILGIITPDSYLLGRYYSKVRKYILSNSKILDLSVLDYEPFDGVTLGKTALTFFQKRTDEQKYISNHTFPVRWFKDHRFFIDKKGLEFENSYSRLFSNHLNRFFLFFEEKDKLIVDRWIDKADMKLEDIASIHTGIRSKIGQKKIIGTEQIDLNWRKGIVSGKQISPYFLKYEGHWINVDTSILWSGGFDEDVINNPKLFIRQTGDSIISCVDIDGYYHLNNCHSLAPKEDNINLYALSVLLNSKEFNQVYQILSMEKGRTFAQIDIEFLLKMPIPHLSEEEAEKYKRFYLLQNERQKRGISILPTSLKSKYLN